MHTVLSRSGVEPALGGGKAVARSRMSMCAGTARRSWSPADTRGSLALAYSPPQVQAGALAHALAVQLKVLLGDPGRAWFRRQASGTG